MTTNEIAINTDVFARHNVLFDMVSFKPSIPNVFPFHHPDEGTLQGIELILTKIPGYDNYDLRIQLPQSIYQLQQDTLSTIADQRSLYVEEVFIDQIASVFADFGLEGIGNALERFDVFGKEIFQGKRPSIHYDRVLPPKLGIEVWYGWAAADDVDRYLNHLNVQLPLALKHAQNVLKPYLSSLADFVPLVEPLLAQ